MRAAAGRARRPSGRAVGVLPAVLVLAGLVLAGCGRAEPLAEAPSEATVAFLRSVPSPDASAQQSFVDELARQGYREGDNLVLLAADPSESYRDPATISQMVQRWLEAGVDVIVALSTAGATAAAQAAPDTPVLFLSNDPVSSGLVDDEAEPDGQLTGVTFRVPADRTLSLATRAVPGLGRLGLLSSPSDPATASVRNQVAGAASDLGIELEEQPFEDEADLPAAITALRQAGADALLLANSPTTVRALPALAAVNSGAERLPVIANTTAVEDALIVLEPDVQRLYAQLASQAARLLNGVPVAEVPVEDPGQFRLVVNERVASELGIDLPPALIAEADEVITSARAPS